MPGSTRIRSSGIPAARARARLPVRDASTVSRGSPGAGAAAGAAMSTSPAPASAARRASAGSAASPVTSLSMRAPLSRAARAGSARLVSAQTGRSSLAVSRPTAQCRRSASCVSGMQRLEVGRGGHRPHVEPGRARLDHRLGRLEEPVGVGDDGARVERLRAHVEGSHDGHVQAIAHRHSCHGRAIHGESSTINLSPQWARRAPNLRAWSATPGWAPRGAGGPGGSARSPRRPATRARGGRGRARGASRGWSRSCDGRAWRTRSRSA